MTALAIIAVGCLLIGAGGLVVLFAVETYRECEGSAEFADDYDLDSVRSFGEGIDALGNVTAGVARLRDAHEAHMAASVCDENWHDLAHAHLAAELDLFEAYDAYESEAAS